jgi:glycosyltransferase involved in cell wall biosynthesis
MKSEPKVSVALCTFNGGNFLAEQLRSLADQDRRIDELVISDDGSADDTLKIIRDFAASAPMRVRFDSNPTRLGPSKNFQVAIERCTGEIILLCDQDDRWRPNKVRRMLQAFDDEKTGLVFSNARIISADGAASDRTFWNSIWFDKSEEARVRAGEAVPVLLRHSIAAGAMLAFRSGYLPLLLPLPDLPRSHDIWMTLLIAAVGEISPIDEALIEYRVHGENQIGLPDEGLSGQIAAARRQIRQNAFGVAADLYAAAVERLTANRSKWSVTDQTLELLEEKVRHSRARDQLPAWPSRLGVINREWKSGNYAKYSYGFKSVLQDLFLR